MRAEVRVLDFVHGLQSSENLLEIGAQFHALIGEFGFTYFFAGAFTPRGERRGRVWATSRHSWLRQWVEANGGGTDPVLARLRRDFSPLRWSSLRENPGTANLDLLDVATEFGLRDGWSLAFLHGRTELPIAVGLGTDRYELPPEHETALHLAVLYFGLKVARLEQLQPTAHTLLSERERECLCWVAAGKTDWDIGEIIGISQQTVHKHVSNALKKLNAGTRAHAVAIALSSAQIKL